MVVLHARPQTSGSLACAMFLRMFSVCLRGWPAAIDTFVDVLTYTFYLAFNTFVCTFVRVGRNLATKNNRVTEAIKATRESILISLVLFL